MEQYAADDYTPGRQVHTRTQRRSSDKETQVTVAKGRLDDVAFFEGQTLKWESDTYTGSLQAITDAI